MKKKKEKQDLPDFYPLLMVINISGVQSHSFVISQQKICLQEKHVS